MFGPGVALRNILRACPTVKLDNTPSSTVLHCVCCTTNPASRGVLANTLNIQYNFLPLRSALRVRVPPMSNSAPI